IPLGVSFLEAPHWNPGSPPVCARSYTQGHTVSDSNAQRRVLSVAIRPKSNADCEKLQRTLNDLTVEDLVMSIETGPVDEETIIRGISELHLQIICDRIVRERKIPLDVSEFKVIYL